MANNFIKENLRKILDDIIPIREIQRKKSNKRWITNETKDMFNLRDNLREQGRRTDRAEDWTEYRNTRNKCTTKTIEDKKKKK